MLLTSSAFKEGERIPDEYTCKEKNSSPPLVFKDIPSETVSLVLIMDDPDAPSGTFDHWVVWNLPPDLTGLEKGASLPSGSQVGVNDYGTSYYKGPCPPPGKPHRYFFKLYALNARLDIEEGASKQAVEQKMEDHIINQAQLMGTFSR